MAADAFDLDELELRMQASIDAFKRELSGLRTGRASAHLLDPIQVMVYGSRMPLNQVATDLCSSLGPIECIGGRKSDPGIKSGPQSDHRWPAPSPADTRAHR